MNFSESFEKAVKDKGQTAESLSEQTKIRKIYIESLLEGDFQKLPPKTFVLGFIKTLSKVLGLSENEMLDAYLEETAEDEITMREYQLPGEDMPSKSNAAIFWKQLRLPLVCFIVLLVLIFKYFK